MKIALIGLLGLSMIKGCDMGDPQTVQPQIEDALRPYFPKVKAVVLPQEHAIVGLSCLEDVGDELVKMVPPAVASNPAMSKLKLLRMMPGSSYRVVAIGFEQGLAFYNVDTGATGTTIGDSSYATWYQQQCGFGESSSTGNGHVWIGYFSGVVSCSDMQARPVSSVESLGVWSNRQFLNQHLDDQVRGFVAKWTATWDRQHCSLSDVQLNTVRDVSFPTSPPEN